MSLKEKKTTFTPTKNKQSSNCSDLPMKCVCHFHLVARVCKTLFGQIKADE